MLHVNHLCISQHNYEKSIVFMLVNMIYNVYQIILMWRLPNAYISQKHSIYWVSFAAVYILCLKVLERIEIPYLPYYQWHFETFIYWYAPLLNPLTPEFLEWTLLSVKLNVSIFS